MTAESVLFALLRKAICGEALSEETVTACTPETLSVVYALASKHDLAHMAGCALEKIEIPDCEAIRYFRTAKANAIYRYIRQDYEYQRICRALEENQIPYMPLKGAVIKEYYPEPWMRTSCDIDILVHEEDIHLAAKILTSQLGMTQGELNYHDIPFYTPSGVHLELHFHIRENNSAIDSVLERVWEYSILADGKQYEYRQTNEFFFYHLLAHMAYHFLAGGCGIRSFIDVWISMRSLEYDETELERLCVLASLDVFYQCVIDLMNVWFASSNHSDITRQMEKYLLLGGTYGSLPNKVIMSQAKSGGKIRNLLNRIFQPYNELKIQYPIIENYKYLTPLFQVVRWFKAVKKRKVNRSIWEFKINQSSSVEQIREIKCFINNIGLNFEKEIFEI